jgi:hypothetical protein
VGQGNPRGQHQAGLTRQSRSKFRNTRSANGGNGRYWHSDLGSPKSDPKRTLLSPSHLITIYEYTPLATYRPACHRWPGISVTLQQGARVIEDSRRLRVV